MHPFRTFPENFDPRSSQVRSLGQVKWPYLQKRSRWCHGYSFWGINMNFQNCMRLSVSTKRISRNFDIDDLRSDQFGDLSITSQWGNMHMLPVSNMRFETALFFQNHDMSAHRWWSRCSCWPVTPVKVIWGHQRSRILFLSITFDRMERYSGAHGLIVFVSSRRIDWYAIWPMLTYLGHHVTLTWGQIFKLIFKIKMYMFRCVSTKESRWWHNYFISFLVQKLFTKNIFVNNGHFDTSWPLEL